MLKAFFDVSVYWPVEDPSCIDLGNGLFVYLHRRLGESSIEQLQKQ